MSERRGFALIAVLWVVVALAGLTVTATSRAAVGAANATRRVLGVRGHWAAEACIAAALAELDERAARGVPFEVTPLDSLDLAGGARCTAELSDPAAAPASPGQPDSVNAVPALTLTAHGMIPGQPGGAVIQLRLVPAGARVAAVQRQEW